MEIWHKKHPNGVKKVLFHPLYFLPSNSYVFLFINYLATHPTTTNANQVTITKVANLPPSPPKGISLNQNTPHQAKKRKIINDTVPVSQNALEVITAEKSKRQQSDTPSASVANPNIPAKVPKKFKREIVAQHSTKTFADVGGMKNVLKELCELLLHIKHPEVYRHIGLPPPRGFLLHGPPGSGKTLLAEAIAGVSLKMKLCYD